MRELSADRAEPVLLHQDFHGGNVLAAVRERWLAIDPKPLAGDPAFDTTSYLRDRRPVTELAVVRRRLDVFADELGLDRERMRGWGVAHALHWGHWDGRFSAELVNAARLIAAA